MKKNVFTLIALILSVLTSCQNKIDAEADKQALTNLTVKDWDKNILADNLLANVDFYTEDAVRISPRGMLSGKDAIRKAFNEDNPNTLLKLENKVEEIWISEDLATVRGSFTASSILAEGDTLNRRGAWTDVCERQVDGSWLMALTMVTHLID